MKLPLISLLLATLLPAGCAISTTATLLPTDYRQVVEKKIRSRGKYDDYFFSFYTPAEAILRVDVPLVKAGSRVSVVRVDWTPVSAEEGPYLMIVREYLVFAAGGTVSSAREEDLRWIGRKPRRQKEPNQSPEPTRAKAGLRIEPQGAWLICDVRQNETENHKYLGR